MTQEEQDEKCSKCGCEIGHFIDCPDGSTFTTEGLDKREFEECYPMNKFVELKISLSPLGTKIENFVREMMLDSWLASRKTLREKENKDVG